jgi:hypothetical protein
LLLEIKGMTTSTTADVKYGGFGVLEDFSFMVWPLLNSGKELLCCGAVDVPVISFEPVVDWFRGFELGFKDSSKDIRGFLKF